MVQEQTYIDFFASFHRIFLSSNLVKNRMKTYWGTETLDGVEVFKSKFTVYPGTDRLEVRKLCSALGMYKDIKSQDFSKVAGFYLTLNPLKLSGDELAKYNANTLANKLNEFLDIGETNTSYLNISDPANPDIFTGMNKSDILSYVDANYSALYTSLNIETDSDTIAGAVLARYVLFDDDQHFSVNIKAAQVTPVAHRKYVRATSDNGKDKYVTYYTSAVSLTLEITQNSQVTETSNIVVSAIDETDRNARMMAAAVAEANENSKYNGESGISIPGWDSKVKAYTDSNWYKGRLRASAASTASMKSVEFVELIGAAMDTGTIKKKVKWYKKLLSVVLAVVAVALALAQQYWLSALVMAAMVGVQMYWAKHGNEGAAAYMGKWAQFASIATFFLGIQAMLQNIAKAITKGIIQGAVAVGVAVIRTAAVLGVSIDSKVLAVASLLTADVSGFGTSATKTISITMKVLNAITQFRNSMVTEDFAKQLAYANAALDASEKELAEVMDKEMNLLVEDIKRYTKPLDIAESQFTVNNQYTGTTRNIGKNSFYPSGLNSIVDDIA